MNIELLYLSGCPNHLPTLGRLRAVLGQEGIAAEVSEIEVKGESEAKALQFIGSPSIRIDGLDIEPCSRGVRQARFACRRYSDGSPSEEMIRVALREARKG